MAKLKNRALQTERINSSDCMNTMCMTAAVINPLQFKAAFEIMPSTSLLLSPLCGHPLHLPPSSVAFCSQQSGLQGLSPLGD